MYTAADIRNVEFTKTMGGYKVAEVDAFCDACADTVQALTAEKEELSKKLSILADKLVEYRRDEDSIRSALLSAQRMGDSVVREAQVQADKILADAKQEALAQEEAHKKALAVYESELSRMKKEISDFKANMLSLYKEHLALLKSIPDIRVLDPETTEPEAPAAPAAEEPAAPAVEEPAAPEAPAAPAAGQTDRPSRFTDLKFGEDYDMSDDADEE